MADLLLTRKHFKPGSTLGELHATPAPGFLGFVLENGVHSNRPNVDAIPAGTWPLRLRDEGGYRARYAGTPDKPGYFGWYVNGKLRQGWHREMVEIVVPERTFILFHIGNYVSDTLGCPLIGSRSGEHEGEFAVWDSVKAYKAAYPFLYKAAAAGGSIEIVEMR